MSATGFPTSAVFAERNPVERSDGRQRLCSLPHPLSISRLAKTQPMHAGAADPSVQVAAERRHPFEIPVSWHTGEVLHTKTGMAPGSRYSLSFATSDLWEPGPDNRTAAFPAFQRHLAIECHRALTHADQSKRIRLLGSVR